MIPTKELQSRAHLSRQLVLPDGAEQILRELGDGPVYRELHELIILATDLAAKLEDESKKQLTTLVGHLLEVGQRLERAIQCVEETTTAELMEEIETLRMQIKSSQNPDEMATLIEAHRRLLDEMQAHDRTAFQVDILRAELLSVRGALLDLRGEERAMKTTLDTSDELRHVLEAAAEVEELAPSEVTQ